MTTADYRRRQREIQAWNERMAWRLLAFDCLIVTLGACVVLWAVFK